MLIAQTKALDPTPVLIWVGVLVVAAMLGGTLVILLRKRMLDNQSARSVSGSLMEELRTMHADGRISDAEYEQTRKAMASRVSHVLDTKRAAGLFELPDPKRRPPRPTPNPASPKTPDVTGPGPGAAQAPPGYDLTGEPLPKPVGPQ